MCGRYCIDWEDHPEELLRIVAALDGKMSPEDRAKVKTSGEIFPTDIVPVLAGKQVVPMQWGFSLDGSRRVINARAETVGQKSLFRGALNAARCLIPASGYYEWHKSADAPSPSAEQVFLPRGWRGRIRGAKIPAPRSRTDALHGCTLSQRTGKPLPHFRHPHALCRLLRGLSARQDAGSFPGRGAAGMAAGNRSRSPSARGPNCRSRAAIASGVSPTVVSSFKRLRPFFRCGAVLFLCLSNRQNRTSV